MYFNGERFWSGTTTKKFSSTKVALGLKRIKMEKTDASKMKVSHYAKWLPHSSVVHIGSNRGGTLSNKEKGVFRLIISRAG